MQRSFYLDLACRGLAMPIGADLVLREQPDPDSVLCDGTALGHVLQATAERYQTPLAFPLMDLRLEKADLLDFLGLPEAEADGFHFAGPPPAALPRELQAASQRPFPQPHQASHQALRFVAEETDLLPVGMVIGPFSLATKLVPDPITPVALAGRGVTPEEDPSLLCFERCLELALATVLRAATAQIAHGARALLVCEPAANTSYLSPRQMRQNPGIFDRFVLTPNRALRLLLEAHGVDLIFHNCGELTSAMVEAFAVQLHPVILSLGSSRRLWEDAAVVPPDVVLYGNLPTKSFYSDEAMPLSRVLAMREELLANMAACGHPHILGSECDVLHVDGSGETIRRKVRAMVTGH